MYLEHPWLGWHVRAFLPSVALNLAKVVGIGLIVGSKQCGLLRVGRLLTAASARPSPIRPLLRAGFQELAARSLAAVSTRSAPTPAPAAGLPRADGAPYRMIKSRTHAAQSRTSFAQSCGFGARLRQWRRQVSKPRRRGTRRGGTLARESGLLLLDDNQPRLSRQSRPASSPMSRVREWPPRCSPPPARRR